MSAGPEEIAAAVQRLRRGGAVAFPTETVYGLGADAMNAAAVARVFALKGRPPTNPLIVHVSGEAMARTVAAAWPEEAGRLAAAFWPGPLTLVLPRGPDVPEAVTAGGITVAVRCPDHPLTLALLEALGCPLVGPSANPSGRTSPTTAAHVREAFSEEDVYVLDGGPCRGGIESTVLLIEDPARILRPGLIGAEELAIVLGRPVEPASAGGLEVGPAMSPGVHGSHYAPRAPAVIFLESPPMADGPVVVIALGAGRGGVESSSARIQMPSDARGYAARLYAALREADAMSPHLIAIEAPPTDGPIWAAVWDRLRRATSTD